MKKPVLIDARLPWLLRPARFVTLIVPESWILIFLGVHLTNHNRLHLPSMPTTELMKCYNTPGDGAYHSSSCTHKETDREVSDPPQATQLADDRART